MPKQPDQRLLLYHQQQTSGLTRFLLLPCGLLAFTPPPQGAILIREDQERGVVRLHPAVTLRHAEHHFGIENGSLKTVPGFYAELESPQGIMPILLADFTTIDPPFALAERFGGRFVTLSEARGLNPLELELARRAYQVILG